MGLDRSAKQLFRTLPIQGAVKNILPHNPLYDAGVTRIESESGKNPFHTACCFFFSHVQKVKIALRAVCFSNQKTSRMYVKIKTYIYLNFNELTYLP